MGTTVIQLGGSPVAVPNVGRFLLGQRSLEKLIGVHPDLVSVVHYAIRITEQDFGAFEGLRTIERQRYLFGEGRSKTMNSRHLHGLAVDCVPYTNKFVWSVPLCFKVKKAMMTAAADLRVHVQWGADWDGDGDTQDEQFKDYPHYQLSPRFYPNSAHHSHLSARARDFLDAVKKGDV